MPTYEYACRDCGEHLEVVQSFKDDALTTCPNCEGSLRKVFSAAGIIFKGSGWHVKDYASKGASTSTTSSTSDTSGDASSSSSSSESSSSSSGGSGSSSESSGSSAAESA
jgi:putative FmdB family regulatory protein